MKILFASSECAPYSKSGGLADVAASLPAALTREDCRVDVITPLYRCTRQRYAERLEKVSDCIVKHCGTDYRCGLYRTERAGVTIWFVEYDPFFDRPRLYGYEDDKLRFAFFSRAVIELIPRLDFRPEILHCNDWETALTVVYLKNDQSWRQDLTGIKTVYTIHNIAYQGQFGSKELAESFGLPEGWYQGGLGYEYEGRHDVNLMKGAMLMADAVTTVSPTYAKELHYPRFALGLENVVDQVDHKLRGILNGIDMGLYDPGKNAWLPYHFTREDMSGKAKCKDVIQRKFGLDQEPNAPLFCSVARLVEQKGIDLIGGILPQLMQLGIQLIIFGEGEERYVDFFEECRSRYPGQLGFSSDYTDRTAWEIFAGADFYLMPSRFEPCGLSQMMAMRFGTVPVVHETGGLKDSVRPYNSFDKLGDGFSFTDYTGKDLLLAVTEAMKVYFGDEEAMATLRKRCMEKDFSWTKSAGEYLRMYADLVQPEGGNVPFEEAFRQLREVYTALDRENRRRFGGLYGDYYRVLQINVTGRAEGILTLRYVFTRDADIFEVLPTSSMDADAEITASFDHLLGMARGQLSYDRLHLGGLVRVTGPLDKGSELRQLLAGK